MGKKNHYIRQEIVVSKVQNVILRNQEMGTNQEVIMVRDVDTRVGAGEMHCGIDLYCTCPGLCEHLIVYAGNQNTNPKHMGTRTHRKSAA